MSDITLEVLNMDPGQMFLHSSSAPLLTLAKTPTTLFSGETPTTFFFEFSHKVGLSNDFLTIFY